MTAMVAKRSSQRRKASASKAASPRTKKPSRDLSPELTMRINALLTGAPQLTSDIEELTLRIDKLARDSEEAIRRSRQTREQLSLLQERLTRHAAS